MDKILIKSDVFNISGRLKQLNKNYEVYYNLKIKNLCYTFLKTN